ncbi:pseudouridine synthase [Corynebacterium bovis]|uniref:pseudouridine synthase n=1 Tax=Corynebacterium bovis TaxID=36808 RepID=UPI000F64A47B|nr:pseudouridine synthase [Corynebacterium bovis]RRQ12984.1 pseudouridylate synthase [Corynebacterium bovis]
MTALQLIQTVVAGQRHRHPGDDDAAIMRRFDDGLVRLRDGTRLRPSDPLRPGTDVWFYRMPAEERPNPFPLHELERDAATLVVHKPPFMATLPRGDHITQTALVRARVDWDLPDLAPAHRLDRLTRGVLLFTTRPEVRGAYQRLFEQRAVHKEYEAVTMPPPGVTLRKGDDATLPPAAFGHSGTGGAVDRHEAGPPAAVGKAGTGGSVDREELCPPATFDLPAGALHPDSPPQRLPAPTPERPWRTEHRMMKLRGHLSAHLEDGEPNAVTDITGVRVADASEVGVAGEGPRLVWRLQPRTGRTHQLRLTMRLLGMPIVDDPIYAEISDVALHDLEAPLPYVPFIDEEDHSRPMGLTAKVLAFTDPLTGEDRRIETPY